MDAAIARRMWRIGEPIHAIVYFAPESREAWTRAGIRGFWRGYFATRAAPLGAVGPELVTAAFYNFHHGMVARAVPEVWSMAAPGEALAARLAGAHDALLAAGIGGCAAHVLAGAVGGAPRAVTQPARGWSDEEWDATVESLHARGVVDAHGAATTAGHELHAVVEAQTDEGALAPWPAVGEEAADAIAPTLRRLSRAIVGSGTLRFPNPMGLPGHGT